MDILLILVVALVILGGAVFLLRRAKPTQLPAEQDARDSTAPPADDAAEISPISDAPTAAPATEVPPTAPLPASTVPATEVASVPAPPPESRADRAPTTAPVSGSEPTTVEDAPVGLQTTPPPSGPLVPKTSVDTDRDHDRSALKRGLAFTRGGFVAKLAQLFKGTPRLDQALFDQVEELLLTADVGVKTTTVIVQDLRDAAANGDLQDEPSLWRHLAQVAAKIVTVPAPDFGASGSAPLVILVVGVNGVGKTTTIGKLASRYQRAGKKVLLAAGDTFRAAAVLQLEVWGRRVDCPVVKGKDGSDPGSVIFDAIKRAQAEGFDVVIADTAGRLHTKSPLMDELKKVARTVTKALGRPADEVALVLDATTGQNAVQQVQMFREALEITGIVLTKLDGSAKGGVVLGIAHEHRIPVRFVGLGEKVEDLREFEASDFAAALFERPEQEDAA